MSPLPTVIFYLYSHPLPCQIATNASRHFVCGWPTKWSAITTAANVWAVLVPGQHILPPPYHPCIISGLCWHRLHAPPSTYHHIRRTRGGACTVHSIVIPPNDTTSCGSAKFALASHHSVSPGMRTTQTAFDYGMHTSCKHKLLTLVTHSHLSLSLPAVVFLPLPHPSPTLPSLILPSLPLLLPFTLPSLSLSCLILYFCCYIYVSFASCMHTFMNT